MGIWFTCVFTPYLRLK